MGYERKVYRKHGGDEMVVASGGIVTVESGGDINVESGGSINIEAGANILQPVTEYAANGAITVQGGIHLLTKAGVNAMTLAAPSAAQEGMRLVIIAGTANAHTLTYTTGFGAGGAGLDVGTFGGAVGDAIVLLAINETWYVESTRNVTIA
jgi:hypothetical protein